jgi:hypothetical protein
MASTTIPVAGVARSYGGAVSIMVVDAEICRHGRVIGFRTPHVVIVRSSAGIVRSSTS